MRKHSDPFTGYGDHGSIPTIDGYLRHCARSRPPDVATAKHGRRPTRIDLHVERAQREGEARAEQLDKSLLLGSGTKKGKGRKIG